MSNPDTATTVLVMLQNMQAAFGYAQLRSARAALKLLAERKVLGK